MMKLLLLPLLLPAVLTTNINVNLIVSRKESERSSQASGNENSIIDNIELETFQLYDGKLKDAIKVSFGKKPDDVYLKSRTPWGDLYVTYSWSPVTRALSAVRTEIIAANYNPVNIVTVHLNNTDLKEVVKKVNISKEVENTVTSTWPNYGELAGVRIHYDINIKSAFKETSFNYDSDWGENVRQSQSVTLGSDNEMEIRLKPGQRVKVTLKATKGMWKVRINYEASISGTIALNYNEPFKGHHFYSMDVISILDTGGLSATVPFSEEITINYYSDYEVVVQDVDTKEILSL